MGDVLCEPSDLGPTRVVWQGIRELKLYCTFSSKKKLWPIAIYRTYLLRISADGLAAIVKEDAYGRISITYKIEFIREFIVFIFKEFILIEISADDL